ncbi:MAG: C13 family peptidase, partial [Rhodospirillaceae bacterium]
MTCVRRPRRAARTGHETALAKWRLLAASLALSLAVSAPAFAQGSHVLVIVGLGGDHENAERFHRWASAIVDAAKDRYGLPADSIVYLGEDPARDKARINGRSTRESIDAAVTRLAAQARPGDLVFIVLIGHGASATGEARFNLPGPDLTAADFARLAGRFGAQQVVFVNTASASGGFIAALSGKDRTIVTATRTEGERNQTRYGEFFAEALATEDADLDKDGRVSMLEAFSWARRRVVES